MGSRINEAAYNRFNASFGKFVEDESVKDSTIAKFDNKFSLNGVRSLKAGTGDYKGNLFRNAKQIADNNSARAQFMKAVADIFGGESHIPASVKAAMKWDDFDGKGRPLTARRIRATWDQIKAEKKCAEIRDALNAQDWFNDKNISPAIKLKAVSLAKQLSTDLCRSMEKLLLPDIRKGKAPSVGKWKAFYMNALFDSEKTRGIINDLMNANDNIGKSTTALSNKEREQVIDTRNFIPLARKAAMSLAMAKNVELANFFFNSSKESNNAYLNFVQARKDLQDEFSEADKFNLKDEDDIAEYIAEFGQDDLDNLIEMKEKKNSFESNCDPIGDAMTQARAFYVLGMSQKEAVSEMMRSSRDNANAQGEIPMRDVLMVLRCTPSPKAKAILTGYFKQLGKQIMDGTLRKKDTTRGSDQLYMYVLNEDFWHVMADCAKNDKWLMGSKEQDKALFKELKRQIEEAGLKCGTLIERLGLDKLFA